MKCTVLILLGFSLGIGVLSEDFIDALVKSHNLHEIPELSKTNLGSDKVYILGNGKEHEFLMSYQTYLPNHGGPGEQSGIFQIDMKAPSDAGAGAEGGGGTKAASEEAEAGNGAASEEPEEVGEAASEEPEE